MSDKYEVTWSRPDAKDGTQDDHLKCTEELKTLALKLRAAQRRGERIIIHKLVWLKPIKEPPVDALLDALLD